MKKRDFSVDMMKTLAAILIVNSHAAILYPESIKVLATGGGIGDSLFFYCSGLLLFGSTTKLSFFNWYKKRVSRIFPVVFCAAIITSVLHQTYTISVGKIFFIQGAWFVSCIMIYYAVYYFIDRYFSKYFIHIALIAFALSCIVFFIADTNNLRFNGEATGKIRWLWFFIAFLAGTYSRKITNLLQMKLWISIPVLLVCVAGYYFFHGAYLTSLHKFQFFLVPFLVGTSIIIHIIISGSNKIQTFLEKYPAPFKVISTLTLNIYLLHNLTFKFCMGIIFPLNLFTMYAATFLLAYLLQIFVNFFTQTLQKNTIYDWREMIKVW